MSLELKTLKIFYFIRVFNKHFICTCNIVKDERRQLPLQRVDAALEVAHADQTPDLNARELQQSEWAAEEFADERRHNGTHFSAAE